MILPNHLLKEMREFCKIKNIPIINGKIAAKYEKEVKDFIQYRLGKDKQIGLQSENDEKLKIETTIKNIIHKTAKKMGQDK